MDQVTLLEMLCKIKAIEATLLAGPFKKDYLSYLNYFDSQIPILLRDLQQSDGEGKE